MTWVQKCVDALALVYAALYFPVPLFWLVIHRNIHFWRRFGTRSFWIALPVWVVSGMALSLFRHRILGERLGPNAVLWVLGIALIVFSQWIEHQVVRSFGWRRIVGIPEMKPAERSGPVVNSGIYAHVRHPRYLALMLGFVGFAFLTGAKGYFLLVILNILLYQIAIPLEERELLEHYGPQYEAYARSVARLMPLPWRKTKPQISP